MRMASYASLRCALLLLVAYALAWSGTVAAKDGGEGVEVDGIVTAMPAGRIGEWTIGGTTVRVDASTSIDEEDGAAAVGARVEAKGTPLDGGIVLATRIEVKAPAPGSMPPGMPGEPGMPPTIPGDHDDDDGEILGPIQALPEGTLLGNWKVGNQTVIVLTTTALDQEHGAFALGTIVEVDGTPSPDGLVASRIESKSGMSMSPVHEDDALEVEGLIEALPADGPIGTWTVAGRSIIVSATTRLDDEHGAFVVGAAVEVKGVARPDGAIDATRIEREEGNGAPMPALAFHGTVETLPPGGAGVGVWTISGKTVNVSATTKLEADDAPFVVGVAVEVKGWAQADGTIEAFQIETESPASSASSDDASVAVEFFNASLGHFFMTASKLEIGVLDAGAFGGAWQRTGQSFKVGGPVMACRFYGMPPRGPVGHFFTADTGECSQVMRDFAAWTFEKHAFAITPAVQGACPAGKVGVRRFYNNPTVGSAMNHRYVVDPAIAAQMRAAGWLDEGIVMCANP